MLAGDEDHLEGARLEGPQLGPPVREADQTAQNGDRLCAGHLAEHTRAGGRLVGHQTGNSDNISDGNARGEQFREWPINSVVWQ